MGSYATCALRKPLAETDNAHQDIAEVVREPPKHCRSFFEALLPDNLKSSCRARARHRHQPLQGLEPGFDPRASVPPFRHRSSRARSGLSSQMNQRPERQLTLLTSRLPPSEIGNTTAVEAECKEPRMSGRSCQGQRRRPAGSVWLRGTGERTIKSPFSTPVSPAPEQAKQVASSARRPPRHVASLGPESSKR